MKICPSCGSSVRDAADACPSCEFDFEEGSSATMRGVPPVESDEEQNEGGDEQADQGERSSRKTAFGMPTADSDPDRVPDVTGGTDEAGDDGADEAGDEQNQSPGQQDGTASIPRDELQGILGGSDSDETESDDPGSATRSIERDSLDRLVGDLDEGSDDASGTATGDGPQLGDGDDEQRAPDESAVPTMTRESGADEQSERLGEQTDAASDPKQADRKSTQFGMPAAEASPPGGNDAAADEPGAQSPGDGTDGSDAEERPALESGPAPKLAAEASEETSAGGGGSADAGDDPSPNKTQLGMSGVSRAPGESDASSPAEQSTSQDEIDTVEQEPIEASTGPDRQSDSETGTSQRETAEREEPEAFNVKGFQETGDSQAADLSDFQDGDPIEPPRVEEEEPSEEDLWSATIDEESAETGEGPDDVTDSDMVDEQTPGESPPSAASLFGESDDAEEGVPGAEEVEFETGPSADDESASGGASPAAKASGIVRPKNRSAGEASDQSGSGLIGGGTYMVKGDGEGLDEQSDLEEVEGAGIDWDEFENAGLSGRDAGEPSQSEPSSERAEAESPAAGDDATASGARDSRPADRQPDLDEAADEQHTAPAAQASADQAAATDESREPGAQQVAESSAQADSVGDVDEEVSDEAAGAAASSEPPAESAGDGSGETSQRRSREVEQTARAARHREETPVSAETQSGASPPATAETARKAEYERAGGGGQADQAELDDKLVEIGQSMFGTVAGILLIVFAAMQVISGASITGPATLVSGIGGAVVVTSPFLPMSMNARSVVLWLVGLGALVAVPLFGLEGGFETRHVFGVLGGALTLVAGLFPVVVRLLESFGGEPADSN